jgi:hypothetical protein
MRGLRTDRRTQVNVARHTFVQNLRHGLYELGEDVPPAERDRCCFHQTGPGDLTLAGRGSTRPSIRQRDSPHEPTSILGPRHDTSRSAPGAPLTRKPLPQ